MGGAEEITTYIYYFKSPYNFDYTIMGGAEGETRNL
jgi:hypothetical protein